jgi:hypothetical protein
LYYNIFECYFNIHPKKNCRKLFFDRLFARLFAGGGGGNDGSESLIPSASVIQLTISSKAVLSLTFTSNISNRIEIILSVLVTSSRIVHNSARLLTSINSLPTSILTPAANASSKSTNCAAKVLYMLL